MENAEQQLQQHCYKVNGIRGNYGNLQAFFNAIPIPTFAWQAVGNDFIFTDYNSAGAKMTQGKIGAKLGSKATDFYHDRSDVVERMKRCFATRTAIEEELSLVLRATGEEKKFAAKYSFFPPDMILLYLEDITARKVAEEKVLASETELRALFGAMTDSVFALDIHGRYVKIGPSNPSFPYHSADELIGKTLNEVFPDSQAASFLTLIQYVLKTRQPSNVEYSLTIDDHIVWFEATVSPLSDEQVFWIARDVTERKLMDEQLQKNLRRLSVLFDIYRQTTQGFDMEVLIRETLIILQKHLEVDCIVFNLVSEDGQYVLLNSSLGLPEKLARSLSKRRMGEGIDSCAILTKMPQILKLKDILDTETKRIAEECGFTDIASYPLIADGKGIATITIANKNEREIRGKDQELLIAACGQLSTALHNVQLFRYLKQELAERERAEKISHQSEERYRLLAENIGDVIFTLDLSDRPTYFSPSITKLLGYTPEEMMEQPIEKVFTSSSVSKIANDLHQIHATVKAGRRVKRNRLELEQIRKDGSIVWIEAVVGGLYNSEGDLLGILGVIRDISERKLAEVTLFENEEKLRHIAFHHALTGLPNRALLTNRIKEQLTLARTKEACGSLVLIGINDFKLVNDSFGHPCGDAALIEVAQRLRTLAGREYTVAHISGDEFALLLPGVSNRDDSIAFIDRIMQLFKRAFIVGNARFHLSVSIGSVIYPEQCEDMDELLKNAYIALHEIQMTKKGGYCFFDSLLQDAVQESMQMANDLREAIRREEFLLYYQPKVELLTGKIAGLEALIRWKHPKSGLVSPDRFIPIAERTGLILPIGEWVLQTACRFINRLHENGYQGLAVAVNISGHQLMQQDFVEQIMTIMKAGMGVSAECLELEITESVLLENLDKYITKIEHLRTLGIKISLDDFGTRYSSLAYLKSLPVNTLKIDKQFIDDVAIDIGSGAIVGALIQLAHALRIIVVAEGVETMAQQQFLQEKQCDQIQGYLFSRPVPEEEILVLLRNHIVI
ncbi:EAL domain-containing protein [Pelosinus sp. sgz500959]|uniref:EAL domain-containing protein n=1 Tax=Pelosinus sp. sgz500959 TaxID=3242472 RepID=UPI00366AC490